MEIGKLYIARKRLEMVLLDPLPEVRTEPIPLGGYVRLLNNPEGVDPTAVIVLYDGVQGMLKYPIWLSLQKMEEGPELYQGKLYQFKWHFELFKTSKLAGSPIGLAKQNGSFMFIEQCPRMAHVYKVIVEDVVGWLKCSPNFIQELSNDHEG